MGRGENKGEEDRLVGVRGRCSGVDRKRTGNGEYDEKDGRVFREEVTSEFGIQK